MRQPPLSASALADPGIGPGRGCVPAVPVSVGPGAVNSGGRGRSREDGDGAVPGAAGEGPAARHGASTASTATTSSAARSTSSSRRTEDRTASDPNDGAAWLLLGLLEAQRGRDAAAVAALRKAEATRPDDPLPAYYLGQALVLVGQPDAAAEAFERALARKPARADLLEIFQALGRVHQRAHRNDKALAVWDRLESAVPRRPPRAGADRRTPWPRRRRPRRPWPGSRRWPKQLATVPPGPVPPSRRPS